jgi:phenylalanyl-tRNA synthetase beta chain
MKVSLSWLKEYVPIEMDPADLAETLTMVGLEVESVSERYSYLETVFVGRITEIAPHPNADK